MLLYSKAHNALILNSCDASLNCKPIHTHLSTLPTITHGFTELMALPFGLPCLEHPETPQDKSSWQTEILVWKMLVLFIILFSPSSHTILMCWSETQPSVTITNCCSPGRAVQAVSAAWTASSLWMHLLLGLLSDWTYCQHLNNISISSPYKKIQPKICSHGDFALIVTWMLLTTFSAAGNKVEPFSQLCASVSLPLTPHSAEKSWLWGLGLPKLGSFQGESC